MSRPSRTRDLRAGRPQLDPRISGLLSAERQLQAVHPEKRRRRTELRLRQYLYEYRLAHGRARATSIHTYAERRRSPCPPFRESRSRWTVRRRHWTALRQDASGTAWTRPTRSPSSSASSTWRPVTYQQQHRQQACSETGGTRHERNWN
ncbi:MAG: hypothetical protein ACLUNZ_12555 [Evtepia sp.]